MCLGLGRASLKEGIGRCGHVEQSRFNDRLRFPPHELLFSPAAPTWEEATRAFLEPFTLCVKRITGASMWVLGWMNTTSLPAFHRQRAMEKGVSRPRCIYPGNC
ncbi:hypothetical protein KC345_g239 [Hortaea werneckii]|nr:hypothetical protein KC345_g239 [Hortaea werneckii]